MYLQVNRVFIKLTTDIMVRTGFIRITGDYNHHNKISGNSKYSKRIDCRNRVVKVKTGKAYTGCCLKALNTTQTGNCENNTHIQ